jgi:hypothetical protein
MDRRSITAKLHVSAALNRLGLWPARDRHVTPFDRSRTLAFMHIPKTAGSSMIGALVEALQPRHVLSGYDHVLFGAYSDFASFAPAVQKVIYHAPEDLPETELVVGHISYDTLVRRYPAAQFTTVLREPILRLLSLWIFWRGHSDARLAEWGTWANDVRLSRRPLADFLHAPSLACQTDNQALRMLLSPHKLIPANGPIDPKHDAPLLAQATERLRGFAYADVLESDRFLNDWRDWLGVPMVLPRLNETTKLPAPLRTLLEAEMTDDALDHLHRCTRLDLHLWRHVAGWRLTDAARLREQALLRGMTRYAAMMAPA